MPELKGLQQFDERNVINLFSYQDAFPIAKGTFVKITSGWMTDQDLAMIGNPGVQINNTVSQRYGVPAKITAVTNSGDTPLGMLLYGGAETDENGEKLLYKPQKAAEMEVFISGQAAPVVTRGVFLYSGIGGTPVAGGSAYLDGTTGGIQYVAGTVTATKVGKFLGPKDALGWALFKLEL